MQALSTEPKELKCKLSVRSYQWNLILKEDFQDLLRKIHLTQGVIHSTNDGIVKEALEEEFSDFSEGEVSLSSIDSDLEVQSDFGEFFSSLNHLSSLPRAPIDFLDIIEDLYLLFSPSDV